LVDAIQSFPKNEGAENSAEAYQLIHFSDLDQILKIERRFQMAGMRNAWKKSLCRKILFSIYPH